MPLFTAIAGVTGVLMLAAGSPAAVPPVSISACDYNTVAGASSLLTPGSPPFRVSNLRITFVNRAPVTATNVRFEVRYGPRTQIIEEAGRFSSGNPITENFTPSTNPEYDGSAACSVQSVTFSDGSIWQPGAA